MKGKHTMRRRQRRFVSNMTLLLDRMAGRVLMLLSYEKDAINSG